MTENQNIEWKESWRDEYLKWICGFANAAGGKLIIGKSDKGKVVGIENAKELLEILPNKVRDLLGVMVDVNLRKSAGENFLELVVKPYPNSISYKGEYYYRSGSTNQTLKGSALNRFLMRKQGRNWDDVPVPYVKTKDLSKSAIDTFRKLAKQSGRLDAAILRESIPGLMEKLHLLDGKYLKRAAVLLFHPDPERFVSGAFVKIGFFRDNVELLYHDEVHGDLFTQTEKTMDLLLTKYLKAGIRYQGIQRIETFPVPEEALREAVLNAVIHKDYSSGAPIQISVYEDRLMIWNSGELPQHWTVDKLKKKHSSRPFNPDIANAFFRAGQIETWGRGIERIFNACKVAGAPVPELRFELTGLWVEFVFAKTGAETPVDSLVKATQETTQETTQEKIILLLRSEASITRKELAKRIGISADGIKYHLEKMKTQGRIRHLGATKAGHWEVLK